MTSSIFSFDALRAAMRLPLRTHLWHAWLIVSFIGIMTFRLPPMSQNWIPPFPLNTDPTKISIRMKL